MMDRAASDNEPSQMTRLYLQYQLSELQNVNNKTKSYGQLAELIV